VYDANGSNQHIGHCRVAFRSLASFAEAASRLPSEVREAVTQDSQTAPGAAATQQGSPAEAGGDAQAAGELAVKVPGDPARWPADRTQHIIISILSIQLHGPWAEAKGMESFTVFWNLLDSLADSTVESTRSVPRTGAILPVGDTTQYNLAGHDHEGRRAQVPRRLLLLQLHDAW
jgi:hypothetical protein